MTEGKTLSVSLLEEALKIQEASLPAESPEIADTRQMLESMRRDAARK